MKRTSLLLILVTAAFLPFAAVAASSGNPIGTPFMPFTVVDRDGVIHEDWGDCALQWVQPEDVHPTKQDYTANMVPTVLTNRATSALTIIESVFRAPIYPDGADVLTIHLTNQGEASLTARAQLKLPAPIQINSKIGLQDTRPVLLLLQTPLPAVSIEKEPATAKVPVEFEVSLKPGEQQDWVILLAPTNASVPDPADMTWTLDTMRKAADDIWRDGFKKGIPPLLHKENALLRVTLAQALLSCVQRGDYCLQLSGPGSIQDFSFAQSLAQLMLLDTNGFLDEVTRRVRVYWDKKAPEPFTGIVQDNQGHWKDPVNDPAAHGHALFFLAWHVTACRDATYATQIWPFLCAGAQWILQSTSLADISPATRQAYIGALREVGKVGHWLGCPEGDEFFQAAQRMSGQQ